MWGKQGTGKQGTDHDFLGIAAHGNRGLSPFTCEANMATTRKTITVTDQQDDWIKSRIAAGEFTNDSEYIRDLIRRDQARVSEIEAIRAALIDGEQSGISDKTPEEVRQTVKKRLRQNGRLSPER
jgi:antitoxin ParD1/3/4